MPRGKQSLLRGGRTAKLKRKENLTAKQQVRLRDLRRYNLQEDFRQFWN